MIKLDYTIQSPQERKALVEQIIQEGTPLNSRYLEILSDYLVLCMEKQERRERKILTDNRLTTVNKRETSFEGLAGQLENGEDGIYNLIKEDKNTIFQPKIQITQHDLDTIPPLRQLRESIDQLDKLLKDASGHQAFILKKTLIELRKDQYIIKQAYQKPIVFCKLTHQSPHHLPIDDDSEFKEDGSIEVKGVSLMDPKVVSAILCNYSKLKEDSSEDFQGDIWYLLSDFEETCDKALQDFPIYKRIVELKIDKMQNFDIQHVLQQEFGNTYSVEYISSLWRNKIPKLIAQTAKNDFLTWQWKIHKLPMKRCSKCGELKPANNTFFSKNKSSADNLYSICKSCRNKKRKVIL